MGLCFAAMAILISALLTFGLYQVTVDWLREGLRHRIRDAVSIAAHRLDATDFNTLTALPQEDSATFHELQNKLRHIRDAGLDYRFVYTLRKTSDGKIRFIVDAEEDPELVSHLGDDYNDAGPTLVEHIGSLEAPLVEEDFYTDQWGTWLTGYAPLPGATGNQKVILCMDVAAMTALQRERDFLWAAVAVFGISLPLSLVLGFLLGRKLTGPIKALTHGAERIARGDLDYTVTPHGNNEIGELAQAFNTMTGKLSRSLESLKKSEDELIQHRDHLEELVSERTAKLEDANARMSKDLLSAAQVQKAFLPQSPPDMPELQFAWNFTPCDELAGDMLGITEIGPRQVGIWVADVCGHGVAAALVSVTLSRVLSTLSGSSDTTTSDTKSPSAGNTMPPPDIAAFLNERFPWDPETMRYFTFLYGILDLDTREFRYVSAGHPGPLLLPKKGNARPLPMSPPAIGILSTTTFTEHRTTLNPGDRLFLYTDGITEAANENDEEFGDIRLALTLERYRTDPLQANIDSLLSELSVWRNGEPPADDLSIVAVELD
jgi:serine phosphatase RsbU (regulator of sigma subunit)